MSKTTQKSIQSLPTDQALSVRQPYAQLLVTPNQKLPNVPLKWIENRSWEPPLSVNQSHWILIHASATISDTFWYREYGIDRAKCHHGAIIGYAKLIGWKRLRYGDYDPATPEGCRDFTNHCTALKDICEQHIGVRPRHGIGHISQQRGVVHWIFAEPTLLSEPIACSGKLRLWTFSIKRK